VLGARAYVPGQAVHGGCFDSHPDRLRVQAGQRHSHHPVSRRLTGNLERQPVWDHDGMLRTTGRRQGRPEQCSTARQRHTGHNDRVQEATGDGRTQASIIRRLAIGRPATGGALRRRVSGESVARG
jgi:hypothetical protein